MKKRLIKNLIILALAVVVLGAMYFTMIIAKKELVTTAETTVKESDEGMVPPEMNGEFNGRGGRQIPSDMANGFSDSSGRQTPPGMNNNSGESGDIQTPPEIPNNTGESGDMQTPPEMSNGSRKEKSFQTSLSSNDESNEKVTAILTFKYYVIFAIESLILAILVVYLIITKFSKIELSEALQKNKESTISLIAVILLTIISTIGASVITTKYFLTTEISSKPISTFQDSSRQMKQN